MTIPGQVGAGRRAVLAGAAGALAAPALLRPAMAQQAPGADGGWAASWAASAHGPYPSGNPNAQPDQSFAFPNPTEGASDQTMRMMVRPDIWGPAARIRFTNAFGSRPLTLGEVSVALQGVGGNLAPRTSRPVGFEGSRTVTIAPGETLWSDPVALPFVRAADDPLLVGRRLAVSFHLPGPTGPMTWHAKALTTSYVSAPGAGSHGGDESDERLPFATASWFFLDMVDIRAPAGTKVVCCFGDSITDGTNTTMNGDDRWPDVLARRLHAQYGTGVSVVNAGIGGNRVQSPAEYSLTAPIAGGPSAVSRLERDVLQLSGLSTVIWMEGINDISVGATPEQIIAGFREGVQRLRGRGIRVVGATLTTALGYNGGHGTPDADARRRAVNEWIRSPGNFDAVADFDAATIDQASGALRPEFVPNSTVGGTGDRLHPNRAGLQAMGMAVPLDALGL
jgi:lysophospholipase L1-like esterase